MAVGQAESGGIDIAKGNKSKYRPYADDPQI